MSIQDRQGNYQKYNSDGSTPVMVVGSLANLVSVGIDVGATATLLTAGLADRNQLVLYPPVAGLIYFGTTDTNLATNGLPLVAGDAPVIFNFDTSGGFSVYAVSDGTIRNVRVGESK